MGLAAVGASPNEGRAGAFGTPVFVHSPEGKGTGIGMVLKTEKIWPCPQPDSPGQYQQHDGDRSSLELVGLLIISASQKLPEFVESDQVVQRHDRSQSP
jgi:hypothetical protein